MRSAVRNLRTLFLCVCTAAFLFIGLIPARPASAQPPQLFTHAQASSIIDVESERIVYEQNGDRRMPIASLTKVMTAIVAIEHGNLSDEVTVGPKAYGVEGSSIYLQLGEKISLNHLLYGLMLRSGNDAAMAIAEHVGGSVEGFVYLMNEKAKALGLKNTQFQNPHGLDEEGHYSSANDLARLAAYALKNETFQEIAKTKVKTAPHPKEKWDRKWINKNKMLQMYEGADGVKTGYTKQAQRTLITSATRGGQQFAAVTLNDRDDWQDHRRMLDYAFEHYPLTTIVRKGERVEGNLVAARTFAYPLAQGEISKLKKNIVLEPEFSTNYRLGERGKLELYLDGEKIASLPLYEDGSRRLQVQEKTAFRNAKRAQQEKNYRQLLSALLQGLFTGETNRAADEGK